MSGAPDHRFVIAGAGLGGALMACYLGREGHAVEVIERRRDPRLTGGAEGRSINLAISTRGLHAFEAVGIRDEILRLAVPMRGRMMHDERGGLRFQPYGTRPDHVINSVSRGGLNMMLLDAAERYANVRLRFECPVADLDPDRGRVTLGDGSAAEGVIIGADGAFSAVRARMQRTDRFDYQQSYLGHGYKELTIEPAEGGGFRMEPHALHIWPRGGYMMIALPNHDGSFTCTLFWPFQGPAGLESLRTADQVTAFFAEHFPDAVSLMPDLADQYLANPNSSLVTVRCGPWFHRDRVVLLGDACHAVVPFYGQGANAAFEDCTVLNQCLATHAPDWEVAFRRYYEARKPHTDALADLAIGNFVEMRDHVASTAFLARKKLEQVLHRLLPWWYLPLYTMVSFSRIPYADAVRRARRQDRVVLASAAVAVVVLLLAVVVSWR